jgi:hypothetical protein
MNKIRAYDDKGKPITIDVSAITSVTAVGNDNCEVTTADGTFRVLCAASEVLSVKSSAASTAQA